MKVKLVRKVGGQTIEQYERPKSKDEMKEIVERFIDALRKDDKIIIRG